MLPPPAPARGCSGCHGEERLYQALGDRMDLSPQGLASFVKLCLQGSKCHQPWIRTPQRHWVLRGAGQALIPQLGGSSLSPKTQLFLLSHLQCRITQGPCHHGCANHTTPSPTWGLGMPSHSPLGCSLAGLGAPTPFPGLALAWVPGHCFCLCCCATGWFLVATSPCCGRRWVPYAGAFIPSADRQPAVWLSNPNCSQCARTKNCLERWQG